MTDLESEASEIVRAVLDGAAGRIGYASWEILDQHLITVGQGDSLDAAAFAARIVTLAQEHARGRVRDVRRRALDSAHAMLAASERTPPRTTELL